MSQSDLYIFLIKPYFETFMPTAATEANEKLWSALLERRGGGRGHEKQ